MDTYRGEVSTSESGAECLPWDATGQPTLGGVGQHNHCRNPNGEDTLYCFTSNVTAEHGSMFEYCDVRECTECDTGKSSFITAG